MKYHQPYGISDVNAGYVNGDPSIGRMGSIPPAEAIEYPQREIVGLISDSGFTPADTDLRQLGRALQAGSIWYGVDTGTTNAMAIQLSPPPIAYYDGMLLGVRCSHDSTAQSSLNVNSLGVRPVVRLDGSPTGGGDITAGSQLLYRYDAPNSQFVILTSVAVSAARPPLTKATSVYVNASTGDDTLYDGSAPTVSGSAGPFKTIPRAITYAFQFSPGPYVLTINVANGTYAGGISTPQYAGPTILLLGAGVNTIISPINNQSTLSLVGPNFMTLDNFQISAGTGVGPPSAIVASTQSNLITKRIWGGSATSGVYEAYVGGVMTIVGPHVQLASTSAQSLIEALYNSIVNLNPGASFTFNGTFTCTSTIFTTNCSTITVGTQVSGPPTFTNPSNVVGAKYQCVGNGTIYSSGLGTSFFPGNSAGSLATGGQYI